MHTRQLARFIVASNLIAASGALAQMTLVSDQRYVSVSIACGGSGPESSRVDAAGFAPFDQAVSVSGTGPNPSQSYATCTASQHSRVDSSHIYGDVYAQCSTRMCADAAAEARCEIVFDLTQPTVLPAVSAVFTNEATVAFISLTGPDGPIFDVRLDNLQIYYDRRGDMLPAGRYTFTVRAGFTGSGGSAQTPFANVTYSLDFTRPAVESSVRGPGGCGRYARLSPSSWGAAEYAAGRLGGHLVILETQAEQTFVLGSPDLLVGQSAIGLRSIISGFSTPFRWTDGSTPTYTNWSRNPSFRDRFGYAALVDGVGRWIPSAYAAPLSGPTRGIMEFTTCPCDGDSDGSRTSADFFDFLSAFFAGQADLNCSGSTTSDDFFEFLTCFFAEAC